MTQDGGEGRMNEPSKIVCSQGGIPFNNDHIEYWKHEVAHMKARAEAAEAKLAGVYEECAGIVEKGMGFHSQVDEILESAANAIRQRARK